MNIEILEEQVKKIDNFNKIFRELNEFIMDVDNIDYDSYKTKLNEVVSAYLYSMDIKEVSELEVNGSSFECVIEANCNIEINDYAYGSEISSSVEIPFGVTVSGIIETDEIVIKNIEDIEVF